MNINEFEKAFSDTILERGRNYFEEGRIIRLNEVVKNEFTLEVEGSSTTQPSNNLNSIKTKCLNLLNYRLEKLQFNKWLDNFNRTFYSQIREQISSIQQA
ncbi:hypothetical protein [Cytobacillus purgationiresistens]|uniref:Zn finger protein n=1 Tax=Cytobacillus purgationiresistens TaxID=863449 RepID=A0ABU0APQ4_9BACI|nr:hypothetical protein [Cytobacillus purgationiresistens]MDQ0272736.1 putative Zn finger protein [Cytobacillus purgationiresistens]